MRGGRRGGLGCWGLAALVGNLAWGAPASAQGPLGAHQDPLFRVVVERDIKVPARDGVNLAVDVYRPGSPGLPAPGRFPALLTRTPYDKRGVEREARYYAERGYVVVANDVRGRYASEGVWRMMVDDPADGYDVVEWIAQQEWCDGKVGTFGTSYPGGTQHALAEARPPHLTTLIPIDALANCGVGGMRHGGAFELRFMNWILQIGAPNSRQALADPKLRQALIENGRRIREHVDSLPVRPGLTPLRVVPEYEAWLVEAMRSGPEAAMWHAPGMSVIDHVAEYKDVPVLHLTGWYDSWTRQTTLSYEALVQAKRSLQRLVIGPWVHGGQTANYAGEVEFTKDAAIDLLGLRLRWYDRWLKGVHNGVEDEPAVLIYVMGTGDDHKTAAGRLMHGGYWRAERTWPPQRAQSTPFYLRGDGGLSQQPPAAGEGATTYTYNPQTPVPTVGGNISSNQGLITNGGYDQRPRNDTHAGLNHLPLSQRRDVLVFRTPVLQQDLEVTGEVKAHLFVSSTAPDTDFTVKLIEEIPPNADYPLGFDLNLGDSILRIRYRDGLDHPAPPLQPGQIVEAVITLYPTSNVFKKGSRLRIDLSSSNYPRFDRNPNTGEPLGDFRRMVTADNTLYHDAAHPSRVILPVVPPRK